MPMPDAASPSVEADQESLRDALARGNSTLARIGPILSHLLATPVPPGCIFRVNTGGPLPAGTDAVIMVEDTRVRATHRSPVGEEIEEAEVETLAQVPRGENVREPGSDVRQGDLVLERGTVVSSAGGEVGTLAFVGRTTVRSGCRESVCRPGC